MSITSSPFSPGFRAGHTESVSELQESDSAIKHPEAVALPQESTSFLAFDAKHIEHNGEKLQVLGRGEYHGKAAVWVGGADHIDYASVVNKGKKTSGVSALVSEELQPELQKTLEAFNSGWDFGQEFFNKYLQPASV